MDTNDSLDYDNLTYDDIFSAIKKFCTSMCNNKKLLTYQLQVKKKANFCKQNDLPPLAPSRQKKRNMIRVTKVIDIKDTKTTLLDLMIFMLKRKMFLENINNLVSLKISLTC